MARVKKNPKKMNIGNSYSWNGVISFINSQLKSFADKEEKWKNQKKEMLKTIEHLQHELDLAKNKSIKQSTSAQQTTPHIDPFQFTSTNVLRAHLDSVRDLVWINSGIISVGQDCIMKGWLENDQGFTIREHQGSIFTLTVSKQMLYTGGAEGIIRIFPLSQLQNPLQNKFCIEQFRAHTQKNLLLSSSSDGCIKLFETNKDSNKDKIEPVSIAIFRYKGQHNNYFDIPTSICWIDLQNSIGGSYANTSTLVLHNLQTVSFQLIGQNLQLFQVSSQLISQPNKQVLLVKRMLQNKNFRIIIAGLEDNTVRIFDIRMIQKIIAHTDAVTCLTLHPNQVVFTTGSHDGSLRTWDLRKFKCLSHIAAHKRKYDQSVHVVSHHFEQPFLASGGADGLVKIFQSNQCK